MEKIEFRELNYSNHAVRRIFERKLNIDDVEIAVKLWNVINEYPDDRPFPSVLLLGYSENKPIHIVAGIDKENSICNVITVYQPDSDLWTDHFTRRK